MRISSKRRGFTLVEILITLALLSIVLVIAYDVMMRMFFSGTVTQWETTLTTDFTNADSRIRDYLNSSSYPSLLTPQGNAVLSFKGAGVPGSKDNFLLEFPAANGEKTFDDMSTEQTVLRWWRCEDGRKGIEGVPEQPARANQIVLKLRPKGRTRAKNIPIAELVMIEQPGKIEASSLEDFETKTTAAPDGAATTTRMVSDVESISVKLITRAGGAISLPVKDRVQVEIEIRCIEPAQANAKRTRKITAEANVGAKLMTGS